MRGVRRETDGTEKGINVLQTGNDGLIRGKCVVYTRLRRMKDKKNRVDKTLGFAK